MNEWRLVNKTLLKTWLDLSVTNLTRFVCDSFFISNGLLFGQVEGLGMGIPLGPTFANIFMSFMESKWLDECPPYFKPMYCRRYVDDSFLFFKSEDQITHFQNYLNNKHPNIKFTCELEKNRNLAFLDCLVTRKINKFETQHIEKKFFGIRY